jgi:hypothetical protein
VTIRNDVALCMYLVCVAEHAVVNQHYGRIRVHRVPTHRPI